MAAASVSNTGDFARDTDIYGRYVTSTNVLLDLWWLWLIAIAVIVMLFWIRNRSRLVNGLEQRCGAAFADIDAILAERHALVPNLVEIARAQTNFELDVLDRLIDAQQNALEAMGEYRMTAETELGNALSQFVNVAGNMPEMRSAKEYTELRKELIRIEEKVTASRRFYNMAVEEYHAVLKSFPNNLMPWPRHEAYAKFSLGDRRAELSEPIAISL